MQTGRLVLQILKRKDYNDKKVKGIIKEFWGTYPYKVSLAGNNVELTDANLKTYKPIWGKMYQWFQYPDAQAELGSIPKESAKVIWEKGKFDIEKIDEIEKTTKNLRVLIRIGYPFLPPWAFMDPSSSSF